MTKFTIVQADGVYPVPFANYVYLSQRDTADKRSRTTLLSKSSLPNPVYTITKSNIYVWIFSSLDRQYQSHGQPFQSP
jgi:hypothetical protein